jgi:acetylornithine deacetylase/succinyl-diaminopimelate desuccinylase-like protein
LIRELKQVIQDDRVEVTVATNVTGGSRPAEVLKRMRSMSASTQDTDLYRALVAQSKAVYPDAAVTPYLFQAGTDSFAWRIRNIPAYGIYPYPIDAEDLTRMHGNDERVSIESLRSGTELIYKTLLQVAAKH